MAGVRFKNTGKCLEKKMAINVQLIKEDYFILKQAFCVKKMDAKFLTYDIFVGKYPK